MESLHMELGKPSVYMYSRLAAVHISHVRSVGLNVVVITLMRIWLP